MTLWNPCFEEVEKSLSLAHSALVILMGHTQGIILDKHKNVALENLTVRYVRMSHMLWLNTQTTCYLNNSEIMYLEFWNWMMPLRKITLWSSRFGSDGSTLFHATHKAQSCAGLCQKAMTWSPVHCLLVHLTLFLHYCLLYVSWGIRPYADISGVSMYVCARCMQMQMFSIDLRLWLNPAQKMSLFFNMYSWVFVCLREQDICTYDSWAGVCTVINYQ